MMSQNDPAPGDSRQDASVASIEGRRKRRTCTILFYCLGILTVSAILTITGMVAALWHLAWWIAVAFFVMILLSQGIVLIVLNTAQPRKCRK